MKTTFHGYYSPTDEEFSQLWKDSEFVFDANVLLNIYRYSQGTNETLIDIFSKFSGRLWIPHQVALEYHRQRLGVIGKQESAYEDIKKLLTEEPNQIEKVLNTYKMHPFIKVADILNKINNNFNQIKIDLDLLKKKHPDLISKDELKDKITELFNGKVGPSYSPEKLEDIYKTGKKRYECKIPPGFEDKVKDGIREYGDLVLWFQIIDHAKETKKPIIFVTDDRKEDWWLKFKGQTVGPQPELVDEIFTAAKVNFYMYQAERFIEYAQKYLGEQVNQKAIDEIRKIKKLDEKKKELEEDQLKEKLTNSLSKSISSSIVEGIGRFPTSSIGESIGRFSTSSIGESIGRFPTSLQTMSERISRSSSPLIVTSLTYGDWKHCPHCKNYGKKEDIRCSTCGYIFGCD